MCCPSALHLHNGRTGHKIGWEKKITKREKGSRVGALFSFLSYIHTYIYFSCVVCVYPFPCSTAGEHHLILTSPRSFKSHPASPHGVDTRTQQCFSENNQCIHFLRCSISLLVSSCPAIVNSFSLLSFSALRPFFNISFFVCFLRGNTSPTHRYRLKTILLFYIFFFLSLLFPSFIVISSPIELLLLCSLFLRAQRAGCSPVSLPFRGKKTTTLSFIHF